MQAKQDAHEVEVERLGFRWRLDTRSCVARELVEQGAWELATTRLVAETVRPGMHVIDAGANFGYFTLLLARLVGETGRVLAFEPVAAFRARLVEHLRRNGLASRVTVLPYGLSDREQETEIAVNEASGTLHWTGNEPPPARERIRLRRLDDVAGELGLTRLDFVKADLDGHEPAFLRGAAATLRRHRPTLSIEFAQHCLHEADSDVREQARLLLGLGYELRDEETRQPFASEMSFLMRCGNFDRSANVLAVPTALRIESVASVEELKRRFGLAHDGELLEDDLDVVETDCDLHARKRRDAEVLCTLAANVTGDCLDLGTSHGRSAFKLATNLGARGVVHTVNMLEEQAAGAGAQVTHVLGKAEIGSYFRARGITNVTQIYANTRAWQPPDSLSRVALAFVDACHDADAVCHDSHLAWQRVAPGGYLAWHDFHPALRRKHPWIDDVMRGIERFVREAGIEEPLVHLEGSWTAVLRKPLPVAVPRRDTQTLRCVWAFAAYSEERAAEERAFCARMNALGHDLEPFALACPGGWWPFARLDAAWRRGDPTLLALYHDLEAKCDSRDVLITADGAMLHPDFVTTLRTYNVLCCADDPESSESLSRPVAPAFDHCFVLNQACVADYRAWGCGRADWLLRPVRPELCDPTLTAERILAEERDLDIVMFCERIYELSDRAERIETLVREFPQAKVRGKGWPAGYASDAEMRASYRRARIGWNLHNSTGAFNTRLVTLPAFGVLQICDNKHDLARVFELGKEAVGFDTLDECIDLTRYYLAHERERREIAARGFERVMRDCTEQRMLESILARIADGVVALRGGVLLGTR